jgi:sulfatase maturation enzyme AslB (radical SAM superfamily)
MNKKPFCKALNNAVSFRIPGDSNTLTFNPCCLYDAYIPFHKGLWEKQRKIFTEAETFLPGCSKCELKEKTHGYSLRITTNRIIPDNLANDIHKIEVVLDTTCNAACIQCGEDQSSLWRKQMQDASTKKIFHIQPEPQIDANIKKIKEIVDLSKVKEYHFWGGEPLLTDTHLKFLREIENPEEVSLAYTTNGSIFPKDEVLELWSKFKDIAIGISIDGIEDKFEYIRWPLKWEKVVRNISDFKNNSPLNIWFHINCCIIPLNVLYVKELGLWLSENFKTNKRGDIVSYNFIRGEGTMDIANTPMSLREEVFKTLSETHPITKVLKEVPVQPYHSMLDHMERWDRHRGIDWKKVFPDIVKHFPR